MPFIRTIYKWATFTATRSWRAHAIISTSVIALTAVVAWSCQADGLQAAAYASIGMALFFRVHEIFDSVKHHKAGDWKKRKWLDHVTPEVDEKGDLLGAYTCLWVLWALVAARKIGGWLQAL